ncbi:hypothetical protein AN963_10815 [Brevibacillus choshinensis]|uniref:Uncharacterized protein n=1 Tax=Brevibacillus choshinensis TaxID=54911 RepID=A0ABR5N4K3_BRECH|nr:hypothetical protein AN963_10815 [Brevibacillus choshinensis]
MKRRIVLNIPEYVTCEGNTKARKHRSQAAERGQMDLPVYKPYPLAARSGADGSRRRDVWRGSSGKAPQKSRSQVNF